MIAAVTYLIKFSLALTFIYGFYALLLKRLTFYNWNRLYLLCYPLACFVIPFINLDSWLNKSGGDNRAVFKAIPPFNEIIPDNAGGFFNEMTLIIVAAGSFIALCKLLIQYVSLRRINKNAVLLHRSGNIRIYSADAGGSFTMGNNIYLDTTIHHSPDEIEKVLQHEMIHVKQKHWIDILIGEMLCVANWFNPFVWMLRNSIRQNLEYIADRQVIEKGYDIKEYQYLLLKISNMQHVGIAAHFSFSGLKNRIYMINKIKSARVHLSKFILIFPLMLLLLFAFRTVNRSPIHAFNIISDTIPADSTKDSIFIGVIDDTLIGEIKPSKNYKKPPRPPVPPIPPVPLQTPPPSPAAPSQPSQKSQPSQAPQPAQPSQPAQPATPNVPPTKVKDK